MARNDGSNWSQSYDFLIYDNNAVAVFEVEENIFVFETR
jgi:hypothetical protein